MSWAKLAKEALGANDYEQALSMSDKGLADEPNSYNFIILKAAALKGLKRYADAELVFQKAISLQPDTPIAYHGLLMMLEEWLPTIGNKNTELKNKCADLKETCLKTLGVICDEPKRTEYLGKLRDFYIKAGELLKAANVCLQLNDNLKYVELVKEWELSEIKTRVEKAKFRLGADPIDVLTEKTKASVFKESPLTESTSVAKEELLERLYLILVHCGPTKEDASRLKSLVPACDSELAKMIRLEIDDTFEYAPEELAIMPDTIWPKLLQITVAQRTVKSIERAFERIAFIEKTFFVELINVKKILNKLKAKILVEEGEFAMALPILELFPDDNDCRECIIVCLKNLDRIEEAIENLRLMPGTPTRILEIARLQLHLGQYDEALKILIDLADCPSELDAQKHLLLGQVYWHLKDHARALDCFLSSAKLDPHNNETFTWLGLYYSENDDFVRAEKCFRKALSLDSHDRQAAKEIAVILVNKGDDLLLVVQLLEPLLAANPTDYDSWYTLGVAYFNLGAYGKAANALHLCLRRHPITTKTYLLLGHAYFFEGKYEAACRAYGHVLSMDGSNETAIVGMLKAKSLLNEHEEALAYAEKLNRNKKYEREVHWSVLRAARYAYVNEYDREKAQGLLNQHMIDDPVLNAEQEVLKSKVMKQQSSEPAVTAYQLAIKQVKNDRVKARLLAILAGLLFKKKDYESAKQVAMTACRIYPLPVCDNIAALCLLKHNDDFDAALRHMFRAIRNRPSVHLWTNLGSMYTKLDKLLNAKQAFNQARLLSPEGSGEALYGLYLLGETIDPELIADGACASDKIQLEALLMILNESDGDLKEDVILEKARPILYRLRGHLSDERVDEAWSLLSEYLYKVPCIPCENVDYNDPHVRISMKRHWAISKGDFQAFLNVFPFDLPTYFAYLNTDIPDVDYIRGKLRILEERYDPKEGTHKRDLEMVRMYGQVVRLYDDLVATREPASLID